MSALELEPYTLKTGNNYYVNADYAMQDRIIY